MIKKKQSFCFLFEKKNQNFYENADAFINVQTAINNLNANKKKKNSTIIVFA